MNTEQDFHRIRNEIIQYWAEERERVWKLIQDFENDGYPDDHEVFYRLEIRLVECLRMLQRLGAIQHPELDEVLKGYPDHDSGPKPKMN